MEMVEDDTSDELTMVTPRAVQSAQMNQPRASVMTPRAVGAANVPITTPIASLTPYQNKWTIKARVTFKSGIRTWNKPSGSGRNR